MNRQGFIGTLALGLLGLVVGKAAPKPMNPEWKVAPRQLFKATYNGYTQRWEVEELNDIGIYKHDPSVMRFKWLPDGKLRRVK
jgi:hypothetical protein